MTSLPAPDILHRHRVVGISGCLVVDIEHHQALEEGLGLDLVDALEPVVKVRGWIDVCTPLSGMTEAFGVKAVFGDGEQSGHGLRREALEMRRLGTEGVGQIDEIGTLQGAIRLLEICRTWAKERVQWGVPIGQHYAIAGKIAEMAGNVFAMEAITFLTSALVDRKAGDLRIETAMCKMWSTETTWRIADEAMQVRGGRGYETAESLAGRGEEPVAVERFLRDCRINMIFEGSSEIMRLFIAREALDPHLKVGGAIFNTQLPMSDRLKAVFTSGKFYAGWYPKQWLPANAGNLEKLHDQLRPHIRYAARTSRKLARGLFHAMARFGPKLDREQLLLSRFVGIATELFAISATCSFAQYKIDSGEPRDEILSVANYFCRSAKTRIDHHFAGTTENVDKRAYDLTQELLAGKHERFREGIV